MGFLCLLYEKMRNMCRVAVIVFHKDYNGIVTNRNEIELRIS